jgi:hypothetical protein
MLVEEAEENLNLTTDNADDTDLHGSGNRMIARDRVIW